MHYFNSPHIAEHLMTEAGWQSLFASAKQGETAQFKASVTQLIAALDESISQQISIVIQHPSFKRLESGWRGLASLTSLNVSQRRIKVRILDASWQDVSGDLNSSFDLKQSLLYDRLYAREFDTAGGCPFGLLVVDHRVSSEIADDNDFDDLYTLQLLAELGDMALCPVALGVDDGFFGDDPSRLLHDCRKTERILASNDFRSWQLLRDNVSSRFLHLVLPEYLQRPAYRHYRTDFVLNEPAAKASALWGNSVYLLARNVISEFDRISWFGFLRSYNEDGDFGAIVQMSSPVITKVDLHAEDDGFWSEQGFVPVTSLYLSHQHCFFSNQSVWKVPPGVSRQLGMLQTNLMACRFGHFIKAQIRDQVGRYDSVAHCQATLESWLKSYVSNVDYSEDAVMAQYPLRDCEVSIEASQHDQTRFECRVMIQPQYQYDMVDAQVVLSTALSGQELGVA